MKDKTIDILFLVPSRYFERHRRVIRSTIWAINTKKTFEIMSSDEFVDMYTDSPTKDVVEELQAKYNNICHFGDLSKRELVAFENIVDACKRYVREAKAD